jgi:CubicO group peptidase (beta-lactamase class C family)
VTEQTLVDPTENVSQPSPGLTGSRLPRSTPEAQGLDSAAVGRLLDAVESAGLELHSLMLLRHGHVVAEGWWAPYAPDGLHLLYSLSKSFTSTAVGLAVEEGLLDVDDLVTSFFPDEVPAELHPRVAQLRVRHLLSMATGHHEDTLDRLDRERLVSSYLALVPEEEPGTWFTYNNGATLMLSAIVTRLTGGRLLDYLRPRLLEPLGIEEANWQGIGDLDLGFSGLHLPTEAIAKFGQLYLQQGVWQGRQLLPAAWVAEATRGQVDNPREPNPDWRQGYGYQFWMGQHGYRGDGAYGQFCLVLPEEDCVVAITAGTDDMQGVLDCVWAQLLPALQEEGRHEHRQDGDGAAAELRDRLDQLQLLPVSGRRSATVDLPWTAPGTDDVEGQDPAITAVEEVADGWRVTVRDGRASFVVGCGYREWTGSEVEVRPGFRLEVAASAAWTGPATFTAALDLVQKPHRLVLSCDCATGTTSGHWNVEPLGPTSPSQLALELARG